MKYTKFLWERPAVFLCFLWLLFSIETFLLTVKGSMWLAVFVAVNLVCAYFFLTYLEFLRWRRIYQEIKDATDVLDEKYLVTEIMEKPMSSEQFLFKEVLADIGKSMADNVNLYKQELREYKEYIELWIHEIKLPIAAAEMIIENHPNEITKDIRVQLRRIEGYTEQALFYARSNEVEKDYLIKNVVLEDVVNEVLASARRELIALGTSLNLHDLEHTVKSDSKWLQFILGQIVSNSIKYAGKEQLQLEIYGEAKSECVRLTIKDNGIGMKASELPRAFDKGFTGENGRVKTKATGIGLYLCKKLCKRLRHDIDMKSEEGKGTEVILTFPKDSFVEVF